MMLGFIIKILPILTGFLGLICGGQVYQPDQQVSYFVATADGETAQWILGALFAAGGVIVQQFWPALMPVFIKLRGLFSESNDDLADVLTHLTAVQTYGVKVGCDKLIKASCDMSEHCATLAVKQANQK